MSSEVHNFLEVEPAPAAAPNLKLVAEAQVLFRGLPANVFSEPENPVRIAPAAPKSVPEIPYDETMAGNLIQQLGGGLFATRENAGVQLEGMGMAVIPKLKALQGSGDLEMARRSTALIDRITNRYKENEFQKWQNNIEQQAPGWKELLHRGSREMVNNRDVFFLGPRVAESLDISSPHLRPSVPTQREQIKIEALIKHLDNLHINSPEFDTKLNKALDAAIKTDASMDERAQYLTLSWQRRMALEAPLIYLDTLAVSKNEDDLKSGAKALMQYLKTNSAEDINRLSSLQKIATYAVKFNLHNNGNFVERFLAKGGTDELILSQAEKIKAAATPRRIPADF